MDDAEKIRVILVKENFDCTVGSHIIILQFEFKGVVPKFSNTTLFVESENSKGNSKLNIILE